MSIPQVAMIPVAKLRPSKRNARTHSKKQIGQLANSIRRFGWTYPILTDDHYEIIAGFGRYKAAEHLGLNAVPVMVMTGLSEVEKRALALADNKIAANAGWDRVILAAELGELATLLPECELGIDITGFGPAEIDSLMGDLVEPEQDPADEAPELEKVPVSRGGDLWLLGRHRLLSGDARKACDLGKLMAQDGAAMVIIDPPCNVAVPSIQAQGQIRIHPGSCGTARSTGCWSKSSRLRPDIRPTAPFITSSRTGGISLESLPPATRSTARRRTSWCG